MIIPVHGLKYYKFKSPKIGDEVILLKEEENAYDQLAIAVYNKKYQQLGYIGAREGFNEKLYPRMRLTFFSATSRPLPDVA